MRGFGLNDIEAAQLERRVLKMIADDAVDIMNRYPDIRPEHFLLMLMQRGYSRRELERCVSINQRLP